MPYSTSTARDLDSADAPALLDRYVLRREVGVGAFGRVSEAFDRETQRTVALKALVRLDPTALHRFKQEFRGFADLIHPNLVGLHALFSVGDAWYLVMDFVDGPDLATALGTLTGPDAADGSEPTLATLDGDAPPSTMRATAPRAAGTPLTPARLSTLRAWFGQLAAGLAALHAHGRIHRDLKPSNILVERATDRVVVVDFGLGLVAGADALAGEAGLRGTPAYMAPEQTRGEPLTTAADLYALGVLLYEALTGALPFGGDIAEMVEGHRHLAPRDPGDLVAGVPEDLRRLCLALLAKAPADRPTAELCLGLLGAPDETPLPRANPEPPFVGRASALAALDAARVAVGSGADRRPVLCRVDAPSGLGKSALLRAWVRRLPPGVLCLQGRCNEAESVPFKALDALVDDLCQWWLRAPPEQTARLAPPDAGALATLFPVLRRLPAFAASPTQTVDDPQGLRRRAFTAFRALLGALAGAGGLVLLLDDVQWGDTDGAALLADALSGEGAPPVLLVVAGRSDALDCPFLARLGGLEAASAPALRAISLAPLEGDEAGELASVAAAEPLTAESRERLVRDAGGNPFFVVELARQARAGRAPHLLSLEGVLTERIEALPARTRRVLEAIALGGWPKSAALVGALAELPAGDVHEALRRLRGERLVRARREAGHELECAHDRIRAVVGQGVRAEDARGLHRRAATHLTSSRAPDVEALAHHWREAGEPALAAHWSERAAEHAAGALAFDRAAAHLTDALVGALPEDLPRLLRRRAELLVLAGRDAEAAAAWRAALGAAPPQARPEVEAALAAHLLRTGFVDEGLVAIAPVLQRAGIPMPRSTTAAIATIVAEDLRLRVGALPGPALGAAWPPEQIARVDACWAAGQGLVNVDMMRGFGFLLKHLRLALALGEPVRMVRGLGIAAMLVSSGGAAGLRRAEKLLAHARGLRPHLPEPVDALWIDIGEGMTSLSRFDWVPAQMAFARALALVEPEGAPKGWELGTCRYFATLLAQTTGDLPRVMTDVPLWTQAAADRGDRYTETMFDTAFGAYCDLCADAPERAELRLTRALSRWSDRAFLFQHANALYLRADLLAYQGRPREAFALFSEGMAGVEKAGLMRVEILALRITEQLARRAVAAVLAGERGLRPVVLKRLAALERRGGPWMEGFTQALRASLALADGAPEAAARHFGAAGERFQTSGARLHATLAALQRARLSADTAAERASESALRAQGLRDPKRFAAAIMPGLPPA